MANLVEAAKGAGKFNTLLEVVEKAGLVEMLEGPGPNTIFAPTDEAFAQLPEGMLEELSQNQHKLRQALLYHVVSGDVRSDDLAEIDEAPTLEGANLMVERSDGVLINGAKVLQTDILTDNGVIHAIDAVLLPSILE